MEIRTASLALAGAACSVIVIDMARALLARRVDLRSEVSVVYALALDGFGLPSIRAFRRRAAYVARQIGANRGH